MTPKKKSLYNNKQRWKFILFTLKIYKFKNVFIFSG